MSRRRRFLRRPAGLGLAHMHPPQPSLPRSILDGQGALNTSATTIPHVLLPLSSRSWTSDPTPIGHARSLQRAGGALVQRCSSALCCLRLCGLCDGWMPRSLQNGWYWEEAVGCLSSAIQTPAVNARRQGIFSGCAGPNTCNATVPSFMGRRRRRGPPLEQVL